jgi:hypothetical protein
MRIAISVAVSLTAVALAGGCSSLHREHDDMCSEIARFANSSNDDAVHSVKLMTYWGAEIEKSCQHDQDDSPGTRLCEYLTGEHTSTEFAEVNFRHALACLGPEAQIYAGPPQSRVEYLNGKISSYSARGVHPGVLVSLEFSTGSSDQAPSLKISAERFRP